MQITRILNNNVVETEEHGRQYVVMGNGIAFGLKIGMTINKNLVEKKFELTTDLKSNHIQRLLEEVPFAYWNFITSVEKLLEQELNVHLTPGMYIALLDHIFVAVKRNREGMTIPYHVSYNIEGIYKKEIQVANKIIKMINERFNIELEKSESYLIAIHIMDAQSNIDLDIVQSVVSNVEGILNIVKKDFPDLIEEETLNYERFKTHIRYFIERIISKRQNDSKIDGIDVVYEDFFSRYPKQYETQKKISSYINEELNCILTVEEKFYILLYIVKLTNK